MVSTQLVSPMPCGVSAAAAEIHCRIASTYRGEVPAEAVRMASTYEGERSSEAVRNRSAASRIAWHSARISALPFAYVLACCAETAAAPKSPTVR